MHGSHHTKHRKNAATNKSVEHRYERNITESSTTKNEIMDNGLKNETIENTPKNETNVSNYNVTNIPPTIPKMNLTKANGHLLLELTSVPNNK
jgi:hypothetical protein